MRELRLESLQAGEIVKIIAGEGDNANEYAFRVLEPGDQPTCAFGHRPSYDDTILGPVRVRLEGCQDDDSFLDENTTEEEYETSDEGVAEGNGVLSLGGIITIFDMGETASPIPKARHILLPPISGLSVLDQ